MYGVVCAYIHVCVRAVCVCVGVFVCRCVCVCVGVCVHMVSVCACGVCDRMRISNNFGLFTAMYQ